MQFGCRVTDRYLCSSRALIGAWSLSRQVQHFFGNFLTWLTYIILVCHESLILLSSHLYYCRVFPLKRSTLEFYKCISAASQVPKFEMSTILLRSDGLLWHSLFCGLLCFCAPFLKASTAIPSLLSHMVSFVQPFHQKSIAQNHAELLRCLEFCFCFKRIEVLYRGRFWFEERCRDQKHMPPFVQQMPTSLSVFWWFNYVGISSKMIATSYVLHIYVSTRSSLLKRILCITISLYVAYSDYIYIYIGLAAWKTNEINPKGPLLIYIYIYWWTFYQILSFKKLKKGGELFKGGFILWKDNTFSSRWELQQRIG